MVEKLLQIVSWAQIGLYNFSIILLYYSRNEQLISLFNHQNLNSSKLTVLQISRKNLPTRGFLTRGTASSFYNQHHEL